MTDNSGCKGCLSMTGAILGITVALITIIKFFFSDASTFLAAVEEFWSNTFLGRIWPGVGNIIKNASNAVYGFSRSSPFTPWGTAILIFIIGGIVKHAIESELFYDDFDLREIPLWALPALLWIFVFYGTASTFGLIVFVVGYILSSIGLDYLMDT